MHKTDNRYEHVHAWVRFKRQVTRAGRSNTCLDNSRKQGCANDCGESQYGQNGERLASGLPAKHGFTLSLQSPDPDNRAAELYKVEPGTAPVLPSRHRAVSRSIWSNTVGVYEICPEMSEAKASFVDHKPKRFGPVKSFVSARDPFVLHREETFKFGNQQIMRLGARPNAPSQRGH
ncbi:unnamed protein product [Symbiodinium sp. KB8]|nr:unnamed protein product [Symbiodinium sp. KB8]